MRLWRGLVALVAVSRTFLWFADRLGWHATPAQLIEAITAATPSLRAILTAEPVRSSPVGRAAVGRRVSEDAARAE